VTLRFADAWLENRELGAWLSAADCAIFNYHSVFTSGAAALARSVGLPLLLPRRLRTVELDEPHPLVFRFDSLESDFDTVLTRVLSVSPDFDLAQPWRKATNWQTVAAITADVYANVLQ
jgi:hypothetical protein